MPLQIRPARASDAASLSIFCETTFRDTFAESNSAQNMNAYISSAFRESIQTKEILDSERTTTLALSENQIAGFYQLLNGKVEADVKGAKPVELLRLYVGRQWHGKGIAHSLMHDCVHKSKELGFETMWLGVWENNFRAQTFYKKWHFKEVGSHIFTLGNDPQRDLLFAKDLNV